MNIGEIPLFAMLKGRLGYLTERQRVISENVANSNTPGYRPSDLAPFGFQVQSQAALTATNPSAPRATSAMHMAGTVTPKRSGVREKTNNDTEVTLDGNAVVLEDQMVKLADARGSYDAAIGFYQKSLELLRMASRRPGGSA
jgi:flagellar basal-body rod protein FlgB